MTNCSTPNFRCTCTQTAKQNAHINLSLGCQARGKLSGWTSSLPASQYYFPQSTITYSNQLTALNLPFSTFCLAVFSCTIYVIFSPFSSLDSFFNAKWSLPQRSPFSSPLLMKFLYVMLFPFAFQAGQHCSYKFYLLISDPVQQTHMQKLEPDGVWILLLRYNTLQ